MSRQKTRPDTYGRKPTPANCEGYTLWQQLDSKRTPSLRRYEGYASVTIPKVCLPPNVANNSESISLQHSWSNVGAQCVNHITNKLLINLFRPGQSFFRLDPNQKLKQQLAEKGVTEQQLRDSLVDGEGRAMAQLDQKAIRPKLYELLRSLVVTGNSLLDLQDDAFRVHGIRRYAVQRSVSGKPIKIVIHEPVIYSELPDDVRAEVPRPGDEEQVNTNTVNYVRSYIRRDGKWTYCQYVDTTKLSEKFSHTYTDDTLPVHPMVWDLADEHDYGTGLVEDYAGDFGTLDTLSESEVKAAILASDFRWLMNPAGGTNIDDFKNTRAGDTIPGQKDDLQLVSMIGTSAIAGISSLADKVISRLGRAFLLGSAITRDAERVTAEEIRMQAQELETSLGGVYSRLAVELQLPIAKYLLAEIDVSLKGTNLVPSIVTGMAALSRNAEAQQLTQFLQQLAGLGQMPDAVTARLKLSEVISTLAAAYGISSTKYVKDEQQVQQEMAAAQQAANQAAATQEVAKAGAQALTNRSTEQ